MNSSRGIILISGILAVLMIVSVAGTVMADDSAAAKVKALVEQGVIMAVVDGQAAALNAIGDPAGPFIDGDLYLFAGPLSTVTLSAHPYSPSLVGSDLSTFADSHGNMLFAEFVSVAQDPGAGWVEYWWPKPGASEDSLKLTYVLKVPGQDLYIGCGYYPDE
jgi:cytochrome c